MDDSIEHKLDTLNERMAAANELLALRAPSKAHLLGDNVERSEPRRGDGDGRWLTAVWQAGSRDAEQQSIGKATLAELQSAYMAVPGESKATLGLTDATGGYIIPNAAVADLLKTGDYVNPYRSLLTVRPISGIAVDLPYRASAPTPATVIAPGSLKENLDLTYSNYTATLYTLARIHDLSVRFLRTSAGAAQADVLSELGRAFALGESAYIVNGTGTGEPFGILPALAAAAPNFHSTFTGATTLLGSVAAGIATAAGNLAVRNQKATAAVMNPADYWLMFRQGADTAGFYASGPQSSPLNIDPSGRLSIWGIPIVADANVPSDTLLIGNFAAAVLYIGADYRVESSAVAGDRWDRNEVGFRGEIDLAFDARAAVAVGAFETITDLHA